MHDIIEKYLYFEKDVRMMMDAVCARHCSGCEKVCCNPDFCRETLDSPFLLRFEKKLQETQAAFGIVAAYLENKYFETDSFAILAKIVPYFGGDDNLPENMLWCKMTIAGNDCPNC